MNCRRMISVMEEVAISVSPQSTFLYKREGEKGRRRIEEEEGGEESSLINCTATRGCIQRDRIDPNLLLLPIIWIMLSLWIPPSVASRCHTESNHMHVIVCHETHWKMDSSMRGKTMQTS
ncbi:hypothetical protein SLEP1_g5827 [Rubroshorea leprosula]|uniref:Uncharacterized protein n=1 Tax=Rubroshorea leprosula TaxID=152421 RepID=A0AAV5HT68_9ROSI|nr:hypothetical protein SLEP1_g5827 [Rubroshorea leprosula]